MREKLIIFDFDGVLCDINKEFLFEGYKLWIDDFLGLSGGYKSFFTDLDGFLFWYDHNWVNNLDKVGCVRKEDIRRANMVFLNYYNKNSRLFPWVEDILFKLSQKYILAILTSGLSDRVRGVLGYNQAFFDIILGYKEVALKPDPEGIHLILKKTGCPASSALIIGDSPVDIKAGKNANILTGHVEWGLTSREEIVNLKPDHIFEKPDDLLFL